MQVKLETVAVLGVVRAVSAPVVVHVPVGLGAASVHGKINLM